MKKVTCTRESNKTRHPAAITFLMWEIPHPRESARGRIVTHKIIVPCQEAGCQFEPKQESIENHHRQNLPTGWSEKTGTLWNRAEYSDWQKGDSIVAFMLYLVPPLSFLTKSISSPGSCCNLYIFIWSLFKFGLPDHSEVSWQVVGIRSENNISHLPEMGI